MKLLDVLRLSWDRALAVACVVLGAVALLLGYIGVSDKVYVGEQVPYVLSGGLGGMFLLGLGSTLWLSADLRDEWTQLERIEQSLAAQPGSHDVNDTAVLDARAETHEPLAATPAPAPVAEAKVAARTARRRRSAKGDEVGSLGSLS